MRFRVFAGIVALGVSASSFASFELALIPDNATKTVHRYDVDNGVYLGSFGANRFTGTVGAITVDQANNWAYVVDGAAIKKFDYNTGEYLGGFVPTGGAIRQINLALDGRLIVANGSANAGPTFYTFGNSAPTTSTGYSTTTTLAAGVQNANGSFDDLFNDTSTFRLQGRLNLAAGYTNISSGGSATAVDLASRNNRLSFAFSGGWGAWGVASVNAAGGYVSVNFAGAPPALTAGYTLTGTSWGHVDPYTVATNLSASQLGTYDTVSNLITVRNLPSQIQNARDVAVVVAPEPASMLALGSGLGILLRRRRKN